MKILANIKRYDYGDPKRGSSFEYETLYTSLVDCGYEVKLFDFMSHFQKSGKKVMNEQFLKEVKNCKPDVIFSVPYTDQFDEKILREIKKINGKSIAWMCDDKWRWEKYSKNICNYFNYVITTDPNSIVKYEKIGYKNAILSQWACNPNIHKRKEGMQKDIDVSFIGQINPWRKFIVSYLRRNGLKIECYGFGWENGRVGQEEMIDIFNRSKISLNLSNSVQFDFGYLKSVNFEWDKSKTIVRNVYNIFGPVLHTFLAPKRAEDIKARFFEVTGCGSFLLSYNVENLEKYFDIGKEIVCYENKKDLLEKIKYYLVNSAEREQIARNGYKRVIAEHTYQKRFSEIFEKTK
jgi:spore maturation protein CgeB